MTALFFALLIQEAEETFRKLETKYAESRSLSVRFRVQIGEAGREDRMSMTGSLRLRREDRFEFELRGTEAGSAVRLHARSDGVRTVSSEDGRRVVEPTRKGISRLLSGGWVRAGIVPLFVLTDEGWNWGDAPELPLIEQRMKVLDLRLARDGDTGWILEKRLELGKTGPSSVRLWLSDGLVPRKRSFVLKGSNVEELYESVSTDEIPDSEFRHP